MDLEWPQVSNPDSLPAAFFPHSRRIRNAQGLSGRRYRCVIGDVIAALWRSVTVCGHERETHEELGVPMTSDEHEAGPMRHVEKSDALRPTNFSQRHRRDRVVRVIDNT